MHLCLLDIDGTLLLTGGAGQAAFALALAEVFDISEISSEVQFAGRSDRAIAYELFAMHGVEPNEKNWQQFYDRFMARLDETLPAYEGYLLPGVLELLELLSARDDIALGLLTGNVREGARKKLQHYGPNGGGLWDYFQFGGFGDQQVDRNLIAAEALASGHALPAVASANGAPSSVGQVVVVGDTPNDIRCGRSIGARCVAVSTGASSAEALHGEKPDVLVETLEEVEPILALFGTAK